jgi:hypothetical protein
VAGFEGGIYAVQYEGLTGRVPVYPLYHKGIANGNYGNFVPLCLSGTEDGYISIADMGFYLAF